ncbi:hypothetical protein ACLOJK_029969 [Asimina triloba]
MNRFLARSDPNKVSELIRSGTRSNSSADIENFGGWKSERACETCSRKNKIRDFRDANESPSNDETHRRRCAENDSRRKQLGQISGRFGTPNNSVSSSSAGNLRFAWIPAHPKQLLHPSSSIETGKEECANRFRSLCSNSQNLLDLSGPVEIEDCFELLSFGNTRKDILSSNGDVDGKDLLGIDYNSGANQKSYQVLNNLNVKEINNVAKQWHCPVGHERMGVIDSYHELQPQMFHAKMKADIVLELRYNGSDYLDNGIFKALQDIMFGYVGAANFKESMQLGVEAYSNLKTMMKEKHGQDTTNEGGFAHNIPKPKEGLELLKTAIAKAGFRLMRVEDAHDAEFVKETFPFAALCVNVASNPVIRAHVSTEGVAKSLPVLLFHVQKGLDYLLRVVANPTRSIAAFVGGSKVSINILERVLFKVQKALKLEQ